MAVIAIWKCDRDGSMFEDKKEADTHDKMLELAETFSAFLTQHSAGISEQDAENIGLLLAKNKERVITACKGKPEALLEIVDGNADEASNVKSFAAKS